MKRAIKLVLNVYFTFISFDMLEFDTGLLYNLLNKRNDILGSHSFSLAFQIFLEEVDFLIKFLNGKRRYSLNNTVTRWGSKTAMLEVQIDVKIERMERVHITLKGGASKNVVFPNYFS